MTGDEMEKAMNFLIRRQEVFAENLERIERSLEAVSSGLETVTGGLAELSDTVFELSDTVSVLVNSHTKLIEAQTEAHRDISVLARAGTDLTKFVTEQSSGFPPPKNAL